MRLETFETNDAVYHLGLGNHRTSSAPLFKDIDFSDFDFMVFEDNGSDYLPRGLRMHIQYEDIYRKIQEENPDLPIFGVDIRVDNLSRFICTIGPPYMALCALARAKKIIKNKESRRDFLRNALGLAGSFELLGLFGLANTASGIEQKTVNDAYTLKTNVLPTPLVGFRDAVTAKKVSEYLVPRYRQQERKTQAALLYGAGHSGIETKLKHPVIADATIKAYRTVGYGDVHELNQVREVKKDDLGNLVILPHNCNLFT